MISFIFYKIHHHEIDRIPLSIRIIGSLLVYKRELESDFVTCSELTNYLLAFSIIKCHPLAAYKIVDNILRRLVKKSIVARFGPEEAAEMGFKLPVRSKYLYRLALNGEEILRYIYPYTDLFPDEPLLMVPLKEASLDLKDLFERSKLISPKKLKEICEVKKFGSQRVVLKRVNPKEAERIFKNLPQIKAHELKQYLMEHKIRINREIIEVLSKVFKDSDSVEWYEISSALRKF